MPNHRPVLVAVSPANTYIATVVRGLQSVLLPAGHPVILIAQDPIWPGTPLVRRVIETVQPAGLVTLALSPASAAHLDSVLADRPELATVHLGMAAETAQLRVHGDNVGGMRRLVEHLVRDCGIRRPLLLRGLPGQLDSVQRERAAVQALREFGIEVGSDRCLDGEFQRNASYHALSRWLAHSTDLDAVLAFNDQSAFGAMAALRESGLAVPDDVVVTGFDNEDVATLTTPTLTSVDQQVPEQGAQAARLLLAAMAGQDPGPVVVPTRLVVRGSTRRPPVDSAPGATADPASGLWHDLNALDVTLALTRSLMACRSQDEAIAALAATLARLAILRCFVVLLDGYPVLPTVTGQPSSRLGRVALAYRQGQVDAPVAGAEPGEPFDVDAVLPPALAGELRTGTLTVQPLSTERGEIGYVLLEHLEPDRLVGEALRMDLSRTLDALTREADLARRARTLEQLVAERTVALEAEAITREHAQARLRELNAELRSRLHVDGLTGICNRSGFDVHLASQWSQLSRVHARLSLLMIDVDHFKLYNDTYGHLAGDQCLRVLANCLREALVTPSYLAARFGGEEFAVILPNASPETAAQVAQQIRSYLAAAALPHAGSPSGTVTVSIGAATRHPDPLPNAYLLVSDADVALYAAKAAGRDRVVSVDGGLLSG